jgi:DNA-binding response OmpR family regulator
VRILLIEDNEAIAEIVRRSLALFSLPTDNFILEYASDGITGLQLARTNPFDGYLIDLDLPDINGLQVGLALGHLMQRDRIPRGWLAAVTAQSDATTKQRVRDLGFNAFLAKPFSPSALNALLRHFDTSSLSIRG